MKKLNTYIKEGLFDNIGIGPEHQIEKWIEENCYEHKNIKIKLVNNSYIVDADEIEFHSFAFYLTNGLFEWNEVKYFTCSNTQINTLEEAPKKCLMFDCLCCNNLKDLKGAPQKCKVFDCCGCLNLESLEGAPKKCDEFSCGDCYNLESLDYAPKCKNFFYANVMPNKLKKKFTKAEIKKITGATRITL